MNKPADLKPRNLSAAVRLRLRALNKMTKAGMPESVRIA